MLSTTLAPELMVFFNALALMSLGSPSVLDLKEPTLEFCLHGTVRTYL